jgi:hypothetical protein
MFSKAAVEAYEEAADVRALASDLTRQKKKIGEAYGLGQTDDTVNVRLAVDVADAALTLHVVLIGGEHQNGQKNPAARRSAFYELTGIEKVTATELTYALHIVR